MTNNELQAVTKKDLEIATLKIRSEFLEILNHLERRIDKLVTKISAYVVASQIGIAIITWLITKGILKLS